MTRLTCEFRPRSLYTTLFKVSSLSQISANILNKVLRRTMSSSKGLSSKLVNSWLINYVRASTKYQVVCSNSPDTSESLSIEFNLEISSLNSRFCLITLMTCSVLREMKIVEDSNIIFHSYEIPFIRVSIFLVFKLRTYLSLCSSLSTLTSTSIQHFMFSLVTWSSKILGHLVIEKFISQTETTSWLSFERQKRLSSVVWLFSITKSIRIEGFTLVYSTTACN